MQTLRHSGNLNFKKLSNQLEKNQDSLQIDKYGRAFIRNLHLIILNINYPHTKKKKIN